jgi:hypothetical protein
MMRFKLKDGVPSTQFMLQPEGANALKFAKAMEEYQNSARGPFSMTVSALINERIIH